MEQKLQIISEKLKTPCSNTGLLKGKMRAAVFFFHYARCMNCQNGEDYANQLINEVIEDIQEIEYCGYANSISGIGTGIEYLVQQGFVGGDTNDILSDFDRIIHSVISRSAGQINIGDGITAYGKYYLARMNNTVNYKQTNQAAELIKEQLIKLVDLLSAPYSACKDIYSIIDFLPGVINLGIDKEKSGIYLNYAVDKLETMVYEDLFSGRNTVAFNPLITAVLLFRAAAKINNNDLYVRALDFLERYEFACRQYLPEEQAIKWSFLYHFLWKACNNKIYNELSIQWFKKITSGSFNLEYKDLILSGMMLLTIDKLNSDDWLNWFPLY